jgi:hypothetical protein
VACRSKRDPSSATLDIAEVPAVEVLQGVAVHLITAAAPELGDHHARPLRDGLRSLQLAFREASAIPDALGSGPGEKWTGPVI